MIPILVQFKKEVRSLNAWSIKVRDGYKLIVKESVLLRAERKKKIITTVYFNIIILKMLEAVVIQCRSASATIGSIPTRRINYLQSHDFVTRQSAALLYAISQILGSAWEKETECHNTSFSQPSEKDVVYT